MMGWIDRIPLKGLILVAVWLGIAPIVPEPHLIEKWRLLMQGALAKPIDIFDLVLHATPVVLLAAKLIRMALTRG